MAQPLRRRAARRRRLPEERHRDAQRALQRADRGDRARGRALARADPARPAPPAPASPPGAAHVRAEEVAPPGHGRLRRSELRHAARRRRGLHAVRPQEGRLHRRRQRPRGPAAHRARGRAVPRRNRRTRPGRAGHAAQGDRGEALLPGGQPTARWRATSSSSPAPTATCASDVAEGRFREDLFARINLWTYTLPGLAQRPEDIEPNIDHLLARTRPRTGRVVRFNAEARAALPALRAQPRGALERQLPRPVGQRDAAGDAGRRRAHHDRAGRCRDRAAALAVEARHARRRAARRSTSAALLGPEREAELDLFDRLQLEAVCACAASARTLSDAGRQLFEASRTQRSVVNDADRLRKYLAKYGLQWSQLSPP